ncbi:MAG: hypothetical protein Q4A34_04265 [Candidatus Saccharibacteria bacterium]|nr:hypothetical protein [Candidatus Saccharibacteria bacterium]
MNGAAALTGTSLAIYHELQKRGIVPKSHRSSGVSCLSFPYAGRTRFITGSSPDLSAATGRTIVDRKDLVHAILADWSEFVKWLVPSELYSDDDQAAAFLSQHDTIVVKPTDAAHGDGVVMNVDSSEKLAKAVAYAQQYSKKGEVMLQRQMSGGDYRLIVIDGEVVAAIQRCPAKVYGDGIHTIAELVLMDNANNPHRGKRPYEKSMDPISMAAVEKYLTQEELQRVPAVSEAVQVVGTANICTGGYARECLSAIPEDIVRMAVSVTQHFGLFICGVDIIAQDGFGEAKLLELNASPGLMPYYDPLYGNPANIPELFVRRLLAAYDQGR